MTRRASIHRPFAGILFLLTVTMSSLRPAARAEDAPPPANDAADAAQIEKFTPEELHTLVAPVALYPDALLAQVIPASAFPSQIVVAYRFIQTGGNPDAPPDNGTWDSSVIALMHYPPVLKKLNDDPTWTEQLGFAGTYQMDELTQAIQQVRAEAQAAGNLQSNDKQVIQEADNEIAIQPADPQVIYVPDYDPYGICEGPLPDPFIWGAGFGFGIWLSNRWDWHHHHIWLGNQWSHGGWHQPTRPGYWRPPQRPIPTWYRRGGAVNRNPLGNPNRVAPKFAASRVKPLAKERPVEKPKLPVTRPVVKTPPRYSIDKEDINRGNQTVRESTRGKVSREVIKPAAPKPAPVRPTPHVAPARPSYNEEFRHTTDRPTVQRESIRGAVSRQSSASTGRRR